MPYDKNLDVQLFEESVEVGKSKLTVAVYSYNEGEKKLQISRQNKTDEGEYRFSKLGRMTKDEAESITAVLVKAREVM